MKDRMKDLKDAATKEKKNSLEMDTDLKEKSVLLENFFERVQDIEGDIEDITLNVAEVKKKHAFLLSTHTMDDKAGETVMETLMNNIRRKGASVKAKLKLMNETNNCLKAEGKNSTQLRIRETQYITLQKRFVDLMSEFSKSRIDYKDRYKEKLRRQMQIMGQETSEQELEQMLESGNISVFTQDILLNTAKERQMLADIESRHSMILDLERSIKEMHDLFLDMAVIVEEQGELLNRIEVHVDRAENAVESGRTNLEKGVKVKQRTRHKKVICGLITVTILAVIIIGALFL